jgi:hypothetical protein
MKRLATLLIAVVIGCGFLFNGCGSSTQIKEAPQTTLGQELLDLDKAHKEGVISEDEYKKLKKDIMKNHN